MRINWKKLFEVEQEQFSRMCERDKYVYFLLLQFRTPYLWGKELPTGADCSGADCLALAAATGKVIRTTANELYRKFFTKRNPEVNDIQAVFFISQHDRKHGERVLRAGEVGHVAGVIAEGAVMNMSAPLSDIRLMVSIRNSYSLIGYDMVIRGLDRQALEESAEAGEDLFGLDAEFADYIEMEKEPAGIW